MRNPTSSWCLFILAQFVRRIVHTDHKLFSMLSNAGLIAEELARKYIFPEYKVALKLTAKPVEKRTAVEPKPKPPKRKLDQDVGKLSITGGDKYDKAFECKRKLRKGLSNHDNQALGDGDKKVKGPMAEEEITLSKEKLSTLEGETLKDSYDVSQSNTGWKVMKQLAEEAEGKIVDEADVIEEAEKEPAVVIDDEVEAEEKHAEMKAVNVKPPHMPTARK